MKDEDFQKALDEFRPRFGNTHHIEALNLLRAHNYIFRTKKKTKKILEILDRYKTSIMWHIEKGNYKPRGEYKKKDHEQSL